MSETTDPPAGERIAGGRIKHGVGSSEYLPGNVQHLVSPIVGYLRLRERDGEPVDMEWMIDRLGLVLDLARHEDARRVTPAEPDAGDVEALVTAETEVLREHFPNVSEGELRYVARVFAARLDAVRRKAGDERAEQIAQAIHAAKPPHITRDYTPVDAAYDTAARIARESR